MNIIEKEATPVCPKCEESEDAYVCEDCNSASCGCGPNCDCEEEWSNGPSDSQMEQLHGRGRDY